MPTYDFRCAAGHLHERRTPMSVRETACPECGGLALRQFTVTEGARIRIPEGFQAVTASDVCADFTRVKFPVSAPPPKQGWAGGFGHTKRV